MNDVVGMRKEAIENAQKACTFDNEQNFEEAIKYYIKAADKLNQLIKTDESKVNRETYHKKALEYISRAGDIKKNLGGSTIQSGNNSGGSSNNNGNTGSTSSTGGSNNSTNNTSNNSSNINKSTVSGGKNEDKKTEKEKKE